jgi:hypothetical protein
MRTASRLDWRAAAKLEVGAGGVPGWVGAYRRAPRNFDRHAKRGDPDWIDKKAGLSPIRGQEPGNVRPRIFASHDCPPPAEARRSASSASVDIARETANAAQTAYHNAPSSLSQMLGCCLYCDGPWHPFGGLAAQGAVRWRASYRRGGDRIVFRRGQGRYALSGPGVPHDGRVLKVRPGGPGQPTQHNCRACGPIWTLSFPKPWPPSLASPPSIALAARPDQAGYAQYPALHPRHSALTRR